MGPNSGTRIGVILFKKPVRQSISRTSRPTFGVTPKKTQKEAKALLLQAPKAEQMLLKKLCLKKSFSKED